MNSYFYSLHFLVYDDPLYGMLYLKNFLKELADEENQ